MKKWAVAAVSATAVGAIAIFAIWAFAVRGSGETVTVKIPESGNAAEYRWVSRICTAIADWDRSWAATVIKPTAPANTAGRAPIDRTISTMRALTDRLRMDIDAIDPPTERAKEAQDYIRLTPKVAAREFAELKPDFSLEEFGFLRVRSRPAAVNFLARKMRVETTWLIKYPYYRRPTSAWHSRKPPLVMKFRSSLSSTSRGEGQATAEAGGGASWCSRKASATHGAG